MCPKLDCPVWLVHATFDPRVPQGPQSPVPAFHLQSHQVPSLVGATGKLCWLICRDCSAAGRDCAILFCPFLGWQSTISVPVLGGHRECSRGWGD